MITFDPSLNALRYDGATPAAATWLRDLRWTQQGEATWVTQNPRMAAPFWGHIHPQDDRARGIVGPWAWNYETSRAKAWLPGTGVDRVLFPADKTPYNFQVAGVQLAARRRFTLLADEMGLGKSCQGLGVLNLRRPRAALIACPAFLANNWADECAKWVTHATPITVLSNPNKQIPADGITILPYSRAKSYWHRILSAGRWPLVIADEVHYLKSEEAARAQPFFGANGMPGIFQYTDQVVALSGTPTPNNPAEMYNILSAGAPEIMAGTSREIFKGIFCATEEKRGHEVVVGGQNTAALNVELRASGFMVRREKADVLDQLPPKTTTLVHMHPSKALGDLIEQEVSLYDMMRAKVYPAGGLAALAGHIAAIRREIGILKAPMLAQYVDNIFRCGENAVVLFMWHIAAIDKVAEEFARINPGVDVDILDGRGTMRRRHAAVKRFQNGTRPSLIIGQIVAAGTGLTLTRACHAVLGEISWSPADNDQAADRVHRISQERHVSIHVPTYPHAVEERVLNRSAAKAITSHEVLDANISNVVNQLLTLEGLGDYVSA